jgi:oxygen-independent coproporphyrinogen-3 oxidase
MHLYLHVPFCARRCSYCDFAIAVRRTVPSDRFTQRVLQEWDQWQDHPAWNSSAGLDTVYFGGGTPSLLEPEAIGAILERLGRLRPIAPGAEITLEANPDDVDQQRASAWRTAGINRVSLGAQSFEPQVLTWMHRTHTRDQVATAMNALRQAGIENISLDLIFGLPAELGRRWNDDLDAALALAPDHLSLYGLTAEPHTPLMHWIERGETRPGGESSYADEFLAAHGLLTSAGFEHYEVSNYGRPGHRAVHNSAYWRRAWYLGLGPSAHSGLGTERRWNLREWAAYDTGLERGESVVAGSEILDPEAARLEELYLGLRTAEGVPESAVPAHRMEEWNRAGWAERGGGRCRLNPEGWLRLDSLVREIA